ncbi:hypothetical protein [Lapidilactobacillus bayanensis]|nr:hypothetical protein [Lapidilactobacillus bayanensis]
MSKKEQENKKEYSKMTTAELARVEGGNSKASLWPLLLKGKSNK